MLLVQVVVVLFVLAFSVGGSNSLADFGSLGGFNTLIVTTQAGLSGGKVFAHAGELRMEFRELTEGRNRVVLLFRSRGMLRDQVVAVDNVGCKLLMPFHHSKQSTPGLPNGTPVPRPESVGGRFLARLAQEAAELGRGCSERCNGGLQ